LAKKIIHVLRTDGNRGVLAEGFEGPIISGSSGGDLPNGARKSYKRPGGEMPSSKREGGEEKSKMKIGNTGNWALTPCTGEKRKKKKGPKRGN